MLYVLLGLVLGASLLYPVFCCADPNGEGPLAAINIFLTHTLPSALR